MRTMSCGIGLVMALALACAQPFTYQGFLRVSGTPANGTYDFRFRLYDAPTGGAQIGANQFANDLSVQNGLFTTAIDFGAVWTGADRYLEIAVRPGNSTGAYTALSPRVKINPTPYAIRAATAGTANPIGAAGGDLSGYYPNPMVSGLQGRHVSSSVPSSGQVLKWNGSVWEPANDDTGASLWQASGNNIFYNAGNVGIGTSNPLHRLHVETTNTGERAIHGLHTATSGGGIGVWGGSTSNQGIGVYGLAAATDGTPYGVYGISFGNYGRGVYGAATHTSGVTYGVVGTSASSYGTGVLGSASASSGVTYGGRFESASSNGTGVYGVATATSGTNYGGWFQSASTSGTGLLGSASATTGTTYGVWGQSLSTSGTGVLGLASASTGQTYGVWGRSASTSGTGVYGVATATSGTNYGGWFQSASTSGRGVYGRAIATSGTTYGVYGESVSPNGTGVFGWATHNSGSTSGVWGRISSSHSAAFGVLGEEFSGGAGHAVFASGTLAASGTKSFQIDHPFRPETHYLNHFCAEGPEPYNLYRGTVVLDARGEAWVQLPDYFEAINRDPTISLTPVGTPMPNLHVAAEVHNNRFKIAGGAPGKKVFWRVEAIRNDRWVQQYGYQTEQEKEDDIKGKYLHPELYGQPKERGIFYRPELEPAPNETGKP